MMPDLEAACSRAETAEHEVSGKGEAFSKNLHKSGAVQCDGKKKEPFVDKV